MLHIRFTNEINWDSRHKVSNAKDLETAFKRARLEWYARNGKAQNYFFKIHVEIDPEFWHGDHKMVAGSLRDNNDWQALFDHIAEKHRQQKYMSNALSGLMDFVGEKDPVKLTVIKGGKNERK